MNRRTLLAGTASVALAGCIGGDDADGDGPDRDRALGDVTAFPWLGASPEDVDRLIVGFEDPSCHACQRFHERSLPGLREGVLADGGASFVYRPYPVVFEWGRPAAAAVLGTAERDREAAWALIDHYYAEQSSFDADNALDATREFLAAETDVDADAVVEAVGAGEYETVIETSLDDGDALDVTTTPTFLLFSDGAYTSRLTGVQDPDVFESALQS
jgi:protein-disulfide isomerase